MQACDVYMISGLGADRRLFQQLRLPPHYNLIHIDWIAPVAQESIYEYAVRLSGIIDTSRPFYLIGLSFGGIVATELTRILHPIATIIISSAATASEIPWYYKLAGKLKLPHLVPTGAIKWINPSTCWFFGANTKEEMQLLKEVIQDMDDKFLRWALISITSWQSRERPQRLCHIHGSRDKVLPLKFTKADCIIPDGEHLMVYSKAYALSKLLEEKMGCFFCKA